MREAGDVGADVRVTVERGMLGFASGDHVMFLQNERGLGAKTVRSAPSSKSAHRA
jgi:hypothetical protein